MYRLILFVFFVIRMKYYKIYFFFIVFILELYGSRFCIRLVLIGVNLNGMMSGNGFVNMGEVNLLEFLVLDCVSL